MLPDLSEMLKSAAPHSEQTAQEKVESSTDHNEGVPPDHSTEAVKVVIGTPSTAPRKTIDEDETADWSGTFAYVRKPVRLVESIGGVTDLFFVHRDKFVVVGNHTLYRTASGELAGTMEGNGEYTGLLVFAPNEQRAVSPVYSAPSSVALYDFSDQALHLRCTYDLGSKANWSYYIEWAANSKVVAVSANRIASAAEADYCCVVFPIENNGGGLIDSKSVKMTYIGCPRGMFHGSTFGDLVLAPDGSQVAIKFTGPERAGAVGVFDTSAGRRLATLPMVTSGGGTSDIGLHGFSSDGGTLVTSYRAFSRATEHQHNVTAWDTAAWKPKWKLEYPAVFVCFGPEEGQLTTRSAIPSIDGTSDTVWDLATGRKLGTTAQGRTYYFENAAGTFGLELMADGTLEVWDVKKNKIKAVLGRPDGHERCRLDISGNGRYVISALHDDNAFEMWDTTVADETASLQSYRVQRPREFGAEPQQPEDTSNTAQGAEWVEIDGNLISASSLPPYYRQKAPPVSKSLFEQLWRGMQPQDVWKLFGGRPHQEGFDSFREGKVMGGVYFEDIAMRACKFEFYPGNGGPGSGILLFFDGDKLPPPLVEAYQVKLK
jgi:WD40 repeat protein